MIYGTDNQSQMSEPIAVGEIQVEAQPQFDEAPIVGDITVTPRELTAAGGAVAIHAEASDNRSITEVHAVVTVPGGGTTDVTLEPTSSTGFEGTLNVPANAGATPLQYTIQVVASDDIGQQGTGDGGAITVAGVAPPADQSLKLSPGKLTFGKVLIGRWARQQFVLRNGARKGSAAINGILLAPNAPFRLVGASDKPGSEPAGLAFSLRPGERRTFTVEFRPTSVIAFEGEVVVQRTDGNQAGLSVRLKGKGQSAIRR